MAEELHPETYPARCDVDSAELSRLKDALTDPDNENWRSYVEEWPPTDTRGNVYPIWFTLDDLTDSRGELVDEDGNNFNPFTGNLQPVPDDYDDWGQRCNTPLDKWRKRYPDIRYCGQIIEGYTGDASFCHIHRGRDNVKTAEEQIQTGYYTKTLDHLYEKLDPWQRLFGWGTFEALMGESSYDFAIEYRPETFDFSDKAIVPDDCTEDGILEVKVGYPTEHLNPSLSLWSAAMMGVQMISVQPRIMEEDRENGQGMMESKTIEAAQLTAPPSEHDPSPQEFKTLETWSEHHLNVALSRLVSDREKLLEMGGVTTDPEANDDEISGDNIVLEIDADADGIDTVDETADPNQFEDGVSKSQQIKDNIQSN